METPRLQQWKRLAARLMVAGWLSVAAAVPLGIITATPAHGSQETAAPHVIACWGVIHRSLDGQNPSYIPVWVHIDGGGNATIVMTLQGPGGPRSQSRALPADGFVNADFPIPSYGSYQISIYSFTTLIYDESFRVGSRSKACTRETVTRAVAPPATETPTGDTEKTTTSLKPKTQVGSTTTSAEDDFPWLIFIFVGGVLVAVGVILVRRGDGAAGHEASILDEIDGDTLVHPWTTNGGLVHPGWDDGPLLPGGGASAPGSSRYDRSTYRNTTNTTSTETQEDLYRPRVHVDPDPGVDTGGGTGAGAGAGAGIAVGTGTGVSQEEKSKRDCSELRARCEKLRAEAKQAEEAARSARAQAEKARSSCDEARKARERAEAELEKAEQPPDEGSWAESEGRRITSHDLRLQRGAAQQAWEKYRSGEISAQELESEWEQQGESEALEELRKKDREQREFRKAKARRELEEARAKEKRTCPEASEAEKGSAKAAARAEEANAAADTACRAADKCEGVSTPTPGGAGDSGGE